MFKIELCHRKTIIRQTDRGGDDLRRVEKHSDVRVRDVLVLADAPLHVEQEVVRVGEVASLLDLHLVKELKRENIVCGKEEGK